jgi:hypothetical protein
MSARPRGFAEAWRPRAETRELLAVVSRIITEYREQLPLALRQIFYILVGRHGYPKVELACDRLGELMNKARRSQIIAMDAIRDDGFTSQCPTFLDHADHFLSAVEREAKVLRLDRQAGQLRRLALWCEAAGMVPQLARIADPYGVEVCSSGGFDSLTVKHQVAARWANAGVPFVVLAITIRRAFTVFPRWPGMSARLRLTTALTSSLCGLP